MMEKESKSSVRLMFTSLNDMVISLCALLCKLIHNTKKRGRLMHLFEKRKKEKKRKKFGNLKNGEKRTNLDYQAADDKDARSSHCRKPLPSHDFAQRHRVPGHS